MGEPAYKDADTLRRLHVEEGRSQREIAEILDCGQTTVYRWLQKHGIEKPKPWRDPEILRRLYWDEGRSAREIANRLGCSKEPVDRAMRDHGIPHRRPDWERPPGFGTDYLGYERWRHQIDGTKYSVSVHRLLAVAEFGFDAVADMQIHHMNSIPWDNRPSNIELLSIEDHTRLHHSETA